jgi:hypothetical protein
MGVTIVRESIVVTVLVINAVVLVWEVVLMARDSVGVTKLLVPAKIHVSLLPVAVVQETVSPVEHRTIVSKTSVVAIHGSIASVIVVWAVVIDSDGVPLVRGIFEVEVVLWPQRHGR